MTEIVDNENYEYLIDEICPPSGKTNKLVRQIIPILVSWAKIGRTEKTYGELNKKLGYKDGRNSSIGYQLGCINDILKRLEEETGEVIPTLNSLVCNARTGLPSEGFYYVKNIYLNMPAEGKKKYVRQLNSEAINYKNWDWVLKQLGLKATLSADDEETIRSGKLGFGGEGTEHKALKEYVANHPEIVEAKEKGTHEQILLSGDRLDVWFPVSKIAVEVKPLCSSDADILRGLFQCVKYKAILDAEAAIHGEKADAIVFLILEGTLNDSNKEVKKTLGIKVMEKFQR